MDSRHTYMRWIIHALVIILVYSYSFAAIKFSSHMVHTVLFGAVIALANFVCHSANVARAKLAQGIPLKLPLMNIVLGLCVGLSISMNNTAVAVMFDVDAPISIAMPVLNTGIVILSVAYGVLLLRERLQIQQIAGVLLAVIGIVLINV